jgi:DNA-binding GntR family transcriptional regulator
MIAPAAEVHWRFMRRFVGEMLREREPPSSIWQQHREILEAIVAGDVESAEARILEHFDGVTQHALTRHPGPAPLTPSLDAA